MALKFSFMTFSCPELTFDQVLDAARRFGYDGIEPRIGAGHAHGIELETSPSARREFREKAERAGVAICCIATSCRFADPAEAAGFEAEAHQAIDLAADLGAPAIRVFGGAYPTDQMDRNQAIAQVAGALARLAPHAADRGVVVCMETHDSWCVPDHVAAVMRRVDHPAVGVNWDIMHPIRRGEATMDSAFETLAPWVRHLHVHDGREIDGKFELVPIGAGGIDHQRAIELLVAHGYHGYLSGEWIHWSDPWELHLPRELATLKGYEERARGSSSSQ